MSETIKSGTKRGVSVENNTSFEQKKQKKQLKKGFRDAIVQRHKIKKVRGKNA